MTETVQINIVVPLYNEEDGFKELIERLLKLMDEVGLSIGVILVDDGSSDQTPNLMRELAMNDDRFSALFLSRNFGHQLALSAGLSKVYCTEAVFIIDGDLQDPPELLPEFYEQYQQGFDVVYAIRQKRKESFLKKWAYSSFYRLMKRISYIEMPLDAGDFSLISRRAVDVLNQMPEESRFLRGMRSWIGFKQKGLVYERDNRNHGDSKYSLKKLIQLALNGVFNFSEFPIHALFFSGVAAVLVAGLYFIFVLAKNVLFGSVPEGFTSLVFIIIFFGGLQLLSIGILGQYLLRIFFQSKKRPLFIMSDYIHKKTTIGPTLLQ